MEFTKIHSDERGDIYSLTGLNQYAEVVLFKTKAGFARGGCIHNRSSEHICILEGEIDYAFGNDSADAEIHKVRLNVGENFVIAKNTPHYFYSLTDSIVLEWGATLEEKKEKYMRYRIIVDKINESNS